ncbi:MAG: prolyl oligopeptidase family serine peptidase [Acidobacteriota bacterium]
MVKRASQFVVAAFLCCLFLIPASAQQKRPMEIDDLFRIRRLTDAQISPDGKSVAYVVGTVDKEANRINNDIYIVATQAGSKPELLIGGPKQERHPRWSPDGSMIAFESNRDGASQIYLYHVATKEITKLTSISSEASQAVWSPDGKQIAFVSAVFPEFSDKPYAESDRLNREKQASRDESKVKARIFTKLLYRHWDSWVDDKRQHVFVISAQGGEPRDVTPGDRDAQPPSMTFSVGDDFAFSPDGAELAYTATPVPVREESWSTNHDIYTVDLKTGLRTQVTTNPAADGFPRYSPDGRFISYRAQSRAGFEADRWQVMVYDRASKQSKSLTPKWDRSAGGPQWSADSKSLYFEAEEDAEQPVWMMPADGSSLPKKLTGAGAITGYSISNAGTLAFTRALMVRSAEVFASDADGNNERKLSTENDSLFAVLDIPAPEKIYYQGARVKNQAWLIKPPSFDPKKKYPLVYLVHGGPQGAWENGWSFRWCPVLWAAQGYVCVAPNPTGSTGFGQKFTDAISHDWGGAVFTDLMKGLDYVTKTFPYIDSTKMAAAGASYGGYMMNWFQGNTKRFKTLVTHDGTFNFYSMYGVTEETWFDEWEHGIPWETKNFDRFSPHKYAKNFSTPNLIIHGELDYRVPVGEGFALFTTLQRKGIPSKFLYFPDEGHWVLKPQNSELWHTTVFNWLKDYLK